MTDPMPAPLAVPADAVILAIDPGSERSGWVVFDTAAMRVIAHGKTANADLLATIEEAALGSVPPRHAIDWLVIEWVSGYGATVGAETFETCWWAGRFAQASAGRFDRITRKEVIVHLHGRQRRHGDPTADSMIWQALIDRFGGVGGKEAAVGLKGSPGPLFGVHSDARAALAVAVAWADGVR